MLSDMHAKWSEKGAQEFVPAHFRGGGFPQGGQRGPAGAGPAGYPGMTAGASVPGNWRMWIQGSSAPHGEAGWDIPSHNFVAKEQPGPDQPTQRWLVVGWNLSPRYSENDVLAALREFDFEPERCRALTKEAHLMWFTEEWHANSLIVSLDGTKEYLDSCNSEPVRFAMINPGLAKFSAEDVPTHLLPSVRALMQEEKRWRIGNSMD